MVEDFTTYDEVDPNSHISITSSTITATGLSTQETANVSYDEGVDFFDGDFTHTLEVNRTGGSGGVPRALVWSMANVVKNWRGWNSAKDGHLAIFLDTIFYLGEYTQGGSWVTDTSPAIGTNTPYYLTPARDEAIGANGQLDCLVHTNEARTVLWDVLTLNLRSKQDFQFIIPLNTDNYGGVNTFNGYVKNLDLGIAGAAGYIPFFFDGGYYK